MYIILAVLGLAQLCKTLFKVNYISLQFEYWKIINYHVTPVPLPPLNRYMKYI